MGLDMFLYRVPKVDSIDELNELDEKIGSSADPRQTIQEFQAAKNFIYSPSITYEQGKWTIYPSYHNAAYWRKFNALHFYFVNNVQGGIDECDPYLVTKEHCIQLLEILSELNSENCETNFPTRSGFFFGSTDYDERYWNDVKKTIHIFNYLLSEVNWREEILVYRASW